MTILHYDYSVLAILSKLHVNCKNISQISGITTWIKIFSTVLSCILSQKHSQTTLTTKSIKDKKSKQTLVK